jgi:hypothetical protein
MSNKVNTRETFNKFIIEVNLETPKFSRFFIFEGENK